MRKAPLYIYGLFGRCNQTAYNRVNSNNTAMRPTNMDFSLIHTAVTSLGIAKDIGRTALAIRDFNEVAPTISGLNDQLLKAQQALFAHNAQLLALQQEQFETTKELTELKKTLSEKGRYSLIELSLGTFVYRVNSSPVAGHVSNPITAEPLHYVCQACFDREVKMVLQRRETTGLVTHYCAHCKEHFLELKKDLLPQQRRRVAGADFANNC